MEDATLLDHAEQWARGIGVAAGLISLAFMLWQGVWQGARRPASRATTRAEQILRAPVLLAAGLAWLGLCIVLWRRLPFTPNMAIRILLDTTGTALYFAGLGVYLWGARALGAMYRPSTSAAVQLSAPSRLVTWGPFAWLRHPLYAGLQVCALGGLLLFRNWTFVFITLNFLTLFWRARKEEAVLRAEFGDAWEAYIQRVPFWIPHRSRSADG